MILHQSVSEILWRSESPLTSEKGEASLLQYVGYDSFDPLLLFKWTGKHPLPFQQFSEVHLPGSPHPPEK